MPTWPTVEPYDTAVQKSSLANLEDHKNENCRGTGLRRIPCVLWVPVTRLCPGPAAYFKLLRSGYNSHSERPGFRHDGRLCKPQSGRPGYHMQRALVRQRRFGPLGHARLHRSCDLI
jgi:hypothetical protein